MLNKDTLEDEIFLVQTVYSKGYFNKALELTSNLIKKYPKNYFIQNLHGVVLIALNNWKISKKYFLNSIKINNNFAEGYNNLGLYEFNLGDLEKSLENFLIAIKLKPDYENAHNNILKILTYFKPKKNKDNPYVLTNDLISKIKFKYDQNKKMNDSEITNFYKKSFDIIHLNLKKIESKETQIYRHNYEHLDCNRYFKVFNEFNAIPKFCFSCFKVIVETKTILELFKLYFIFDKFNFGFNNSRKLMIESRENVSGNYKGFIYCSSVEEGEKIKKKLKDILMKNIGNDCSISFKRGCSEFALKYPLYKKASINANEMMPYNKTWESKEKIIDNRIWNKNSKKGIIYPYLIGPSLRDILVMRNWLLYARKIGDNSFH